jgi:hypothetical protein
MSQETNEHHTVGKGPDPRSIARLTITSERHRETKWMWWPPQNPVDVDPSSEMDQWLYHIFEHLRRVGVAGWEYHGLEYDGKKELKRIYIVTPRHGLLRSELSLVHYGDELYVFISGKELHPSDEQMLHWMNAIDHAGRRLSEKHPSFDWWAIIGPQIDGSQIRCLGNQIAVGSLRIREIDWACYETYGGLLSRRKRLWLPALVEGTSHGYCWDSASADAHRNIRRLCSLLSLETDCYWTLRDDARIDGQKPLVRPALPMGAVEPCPPDKERELRDQKVDIDVKRMQAAWDHCCKDPRAQIPVDAYHQGMGLEEEHPSFALIAFVSAIEGVGRLQFEEETPPKCDGCGQRRFNPARRLFQKAIELVESPERAKRITDELYAWRSGTAHSGRTFGLENTLNRQAYSYLSFNRSAEDEFGTRGVYRARQIARSLLLKLFSGEFARP